MAKHLPSHAPVVIDNGTGYTKCVLAAPPARVAFPVPLPPRVRLADGLTCARPRGV